MTVPIEESLVRLRNTVLVEIVLGGKPLGIPEGCVAFITPLRRDRLAAYLKDWSVPLGDFKKLFRSLPLQFKGALSQFKEYRLKDVTLPVMVPSAMDLPEFPDDTATFVVVLSEGNRHGALLCSEVRQQGKIIVRVGRTNNGDISTIGYLQDDDQVPILNVTSLLMQQGFFLV